MVKNAFKFTQQGTIKIFACYDYFNQQLIIQVRDPGLGIASEDLSKLFSRFGKLHRTANLNHEGIGLGLTIVKQIV